MDPLLGVNFKTEIQGGTATGDAITAISQANPAVVTGTNSYSNGDVVVLDIPDGMQQLDGAACRVAAVTGTSYELEGVDSTNFEAFGTGTGTGYKVSSWLTLGWATRVDLPNAAPTELDASTLLDTVGKIVYGRPGAQAGTIDGIFKPTDSGMAALRAATSNQASLAFRLTWATGEKAVFNANVSAGSGFSQDNNAIATTSVAVSVKAFPSFFTV